MTRLLKTSLAMTATSLAFISTGAWAGLVFASEPYRDARATSGSSLPVEATTGSTTLTAAERRSIFANPDGTVSHEQYRAAMERRWDMLAKDSSGNVPVPTAIEDDGDKQPAPSLMWVPNF